MEKMASLVVPCLLLVGLNAQAFDCNGSYSDGEPYIRAGIESGVSTDGKAFEDGGGFLNVEGISRCEAHHICGSLGMRLPTISELRDNHDKLGGKPYRDAGQSWVWSSSLVSVEGHIYAYAFNKWGLHGVVSLDSREGYDSARCVRQNQPD